MRLRYAIFDLDMTLIDSIVPLTTSANLLAREFGLPEVTYEAVLAAEKGAPNVTFESLWQALWGRYDPAWYEAYRERLAEREYAVMTLYPDVRETLETLKARGIALGLASNRDLPRRALAALGVEAFFQAVVGQLDVPRPKPAPDMLLKALDLLGAGPEEAVYIGDAAGDIICASAAGIKCFAMTTGGHSAEKLSALGAWKTGDHLSEVVDLFC